MKILKSSLKEFKAAFPEFEEVKDEDVEYYILHVNNSKAGAIKYLKTGLFDFVNIENIPVDKSNPNFEYDFISLFANKFSRDYDLEKSYRGETETYDLYEIERQNEETLKAINRYDKMYLISKVALIAILLMLIVIATVII